MSNNRKVQSEIDKLLKKVEEGIEVYDEVHDKYQNSATQAQKEKIEADLKKEIKKLQRLREQVKALCASNEVKDKLSLETTRREIEIKMEAFKVLERETKTKAYSKEGLANAANSSTETPLELTSNWINEAISDLKEQIETTEFEVQDFGTAPAVKKGKKIGKGSEDPRVTRLNRLKLFVLKLEQVLRMLNNEELDPEEVDEAQSRIQQFVNDNANDDFDINEEEILEQFNLPEIPNKTDDEAAEKEKNLAEIAAKIAIEKKATSTPVTQAAPKVEEKQKETGGCVVMNEKKTPLTGAEKVSENTPPIKAATAKTLATATAAPAPLPGSASITASTLSTVTQANTSATTSPSVTAAKSPDSQSATKKAPVTQLPPAKPMAEVVRAAVSKGTTPPTLHSTSMSGKGSGIQVSEGELLEDGDCNNDDTFGDAAIPFGGGTLAEMAMMTNNPASTGDWGRGKPNLTAPAAAGVSPFPANKGTPSAPAPAASSPPRIASPTVQESVAAATSASCTTSAAPSTATATKSLDSLKAILRSRDEELRDSAALLEMSMRNRPHLTDVERAKVAPPANPTITPDFFPKVSYRGFNDPRTIRNFDICTLFFIFYYQQNTYLQYLAAKELKRQGFRYHTKFHTWFQRHDKPSYNDNQYEQGSYVYFDYENGWCQRIKKDFQFKYMYLEEDI